MVEGGPRITTIELQNESDVPGMDDEAFQQQAEKTKSGCPVSKALTGTEIKLSAKLKS
jgi:osmotically inducible protein OsmC